MFSRLREHFGTAGLVVAVVALVVALAGGAIAASGGSGDAGEAGTKAAASAKKSASAATRGPRGPRGAKGPTGPTGPAGVQGPQGERGAAGADGKDGVNGTGGANGESVTGTLEPPGPNCPAGGFKLVSAGNTVNYVCNGLNGSSGGGGFPKTLPVGETETGAFLVKGTSEDGEGLWTTIDFAIPLANPISGANVHYITNNAGGPCTGSVASPTAESGHLCIYETVAAGTAFSEAAKLDLSDAGSSKTGILMVFSTPSPPTNAGDPPKIGYAVGSWAVTG